MNLRWKEWIIIAGGLTGSLVLLNSALAGDWTLFLVAVGTVGFISLVILAKYPAYLAFGVLAPFGVSLVVVKQVPTIALVLIVCMIAISLRATVKRRAASYRGRLDSLMMIFYLYLLVRYACDPVLPGYAIGISEDVTGFRSWLDHLIGLIVFLCLGFIITSREDVQRLFRWLALLSLVFTIIFIGLMFVPGQALSSTLESMGIFVTTFGNSWRRFVFLSTMGMFMIMASLLPALFRTTPFQRRFYMAAGLVAVVAGGSRGSVLSLLIMVGVIWMLEKRRWALGILLIAMVGLAVMANAIVGQGPARTATPWMRVMGSFSPGLSTEIGIMNTMEWRLIRWKRAIEDIKQHPWAGVGYGGVRAYFRMLSDIQETSPDLDVERDVATGSTHNGYISAARNLGIPITVLFVVIVIRRMRVHWNKAKTRYRHDMLLSEAHVFLCAYLAMMLGIMMTGGEIRIPAFWVFMVLGLVVERLDSELAAPSCRDLNKDGAAPVQTAASPIARFS